MDEVHSSPEAMHESIEKIIDLALYKASDDEPIKIRFITPLSSAEWILDGEYCDYRLTTLDEHRNGMEYVTVSYCWQHEQSTQGLPAVPSYTIIDPNKTLHEGPKPISCPPLVFHRAMQFARSRNCPYLWIDQECIDQKDSSDIEKHLKIMHRVYRESTWTVVPLSHVLTGNASSNSLIRYLSDDFPELDPSWDIDYGHLVRHEDLSLSEKLLKAALMHMDIAAHVLEGMALDRWFKRTWTFQEKHCASSLYFLVPIKPCHEGLAEATVNHIVGNDVCINLDRIESRFSKDHVQKMLAVDRAFKELTEFDGANPMVERPLETVQKFFVSSYSVSGSDITSMTDAALLLEYCDNLVPADRLTIYGQVLQLPYRLNSRKLDSEEYDYSTCVIALMLGNFCNSHSERWKLIWCMWMVEDEGMDSLLKCLAYVRVHLKDGYVIL